MQFHEFFCLDFFKFSGLLCSFDSPAAELDVIGSASSRTVADVAVEDFLPWKKKFLPISR